MMICLFLDIYSTISSPIYTEEKEEKIGAAYVIAITLAAVAVAIIMGSTLLCLGMFHFFHQMSKHIKRLHNAVKIKS